MIERLLSSNERIPRMASLSNVDMVHDDKDEKVNVKSRWAFCRVASRVTFPARETIPSHPPEPTRNA